MPAIGPKGRTAKLSFKTVMQSKNNAGCDTPTEEQDCFFGPVGLQEMKKQAQTKYFSLGVSASEQNFARVLKSANLQTKSPKVSMKVPLTHNDLKAGI